MNVSFSIKRVCDLMTGYCCQGDVVATSKSQGKETEIGLLNQAQLSKSDAHG